MPGGQVHPVKSHNSPCNRAQVIKRPSAGEDAAPEGHSFQLYHSQLPNETKCTYKVPAGNECLDNDVEGDVVDRDGSDNPPSPNNETLPYSGCHQILDVGMDHNVACPDEAISDFELRETLLARVERLEDIEVSTEMAVEERALIRASTHRRPESSSSSVHAISRGEGILASISVHDPYAMNVGNSLSGQDDPVPPNSIFSGNDDNSASPRSSQPLLRWVYDIDNQDITCAERLEKTNWVRALEKL